MTRIHVSDTDGNESVIDEYDFRDAVRLAATPQPGGDGGVKVIENVTILSWDEDPAKLTFIIRGISYTPL